MPHTRTPVFPHSIAITPPIWWDIDVLIGNHCNFRPAKPCGWLLIKTDLPSQDEVLQNSNQNIIGVYSVLLEHAKEQDVRQRTPVWINIFFFPGRVYY